MKENTALVAMARMWGDLEHNIFQNGIHTFLQGWDDMDLCRLLESWAELYARTQDQHKKLEDFFSEMVQSLYGEEQRRARLDDAWETERAPEPDFLPNVILVELNSKTGYQRFALTHEEFRKKYPEAHASFGPITEGNPFELNPEEQIWFEPCTVYDEKWTVFFSDMADGLPQSDIDSGNLAQIRLEEFGELKDYISPYTYVAANEHTGDTESVLLAQWRKAQGFGEAI